MNAPALLPERATDRQILTYYGLPAVKPSLWGGLVSGYIFIAGVGGSAQIIATAADFARDPRLAPVIRQGRYIALGAAILGAPLLIIDLHTPQRWYNMLRIFRRTSPMSIGTWVLMSFGLSSFAVAALQYVSGRLRRPSRTMQTTMKLLEVPAALTGMAMSTYTGALLSATSTPLWAAAPCQIAALFGASAMASGTAALALAGQCRGASSEAGRALDRIAFLASAVEVVLMLSLRRRLYEKGVAEALGDRGSGLAYDFGAVMLGAGVPMLHHGRRILRPNRARRPSMMVSLAVLAGGFLLRHILLSAGNDSARRPNDYFRFAGGPRQ
ncbi:MAG: polysulfide reductase NrfD [Alphaproteobacteria bacterium]|nr:polysulfide reductase NrfD [Alphaproteobacteria bacterium]